MRKENWKSRLKNHPLFIKLVEYGNELNACLDQIGVISKTIDRLRENIPLEVMQYLPKDVCIKIFPKWHRSIKLVQLGRFHADWFDTNGIRRYRQLASINLRSIRRGRISYYMFPLAYFLGCVDDFELLAMSNSDKYKWMVKDLLTVIKSTRKAKRGEK